MFLEKIVEYKKWEIENRKKKSSILDFNLMNPIEVSFYKQLSKKGISIIAEVKKASPSKGIIREDFHPIEIAKEYEESSVAAISVLTEKRFFLGDENYLEDISKLVKIPTLRKDFIIDEFQIYEAKHLGAAAILLISEILEYKELLKFIELAHKLGMDVLCECHSLDPLKKILDTPAKIIGINNRDLKTFNVDLNNSLDLREHIMKSHIVVSESGIKTREDIVKLERSMIDAVLIGETLMRSKSIKNEIKNLLGE